MTPANDLHTLLTRRHFFGRGALGLGTAALASLLPSQSAVAERISATPFAVAVEVVLTDLDRIITNLRDSLRTPRDGEVDGLLKEFHDTARALHTEIELPADSPWGRQLAASRAEAARLLEGEIDSLPAHVRRLLRPRAGREAVAPLSAYDLDDVEAKLALAAACRTYAGELAVSEAALLL